MNHRRDNPGEHADKAHNGARTSLYRIIDMIKQGHDTASLKTWCEKELSRMSKCRQRDET